MERRGVPAAAIAVEQLARTVGMAMAMTHGVPDYPIVMIPMDADIASVVDGSYLSATGAGSEIDRFAREVASIWLHGVISEDADHAQGGADG